MIGHIGHPLELLDDKFSGFPCVGIVIGSPSGLFFPGDDILPSTMFSLESLLYTTFLLLSGDVVFPGCPDLG